MPITQSESGLTEQDYSELEAARLDGTYQLIAHQYDLDFSLLAEGSGNASGSFDAALWNDTLYRLVGTILEYYDGNSWEEVSGFSAVSGAQATGGILVAEDDALTVFQVSGTGANQTVYRTTYDGSWDSWSQLNATEFEIVATAAGRSDRCHIAVASGSDRYELIAIDNGALVRQDLHWPFPVESMSAAALGDRDVICMTTMMPGMIQTRVVNMTVVKKVIPAGGVVAFTFQNSSYSDHLEVDIVDEWQPWRYRRHVKLSQIDDTLYALAYASDGTRLQQVYGYRLYSTKDGIHWSRGEFISLASPTPYGAKLLRDDSGTAYVLQAVKGYSAPSTLMVGLSAASMQLDITDHVLSASANFAGMLQLGLELSGQWDGTILDGTHTVALVLKEGYGEHLVQTAILEVDSYNQIKALQDNSYTDVLRLTARDRLSWMVDKSQSEQFQYRDPQAVGADDYTDNTQSGYGGLAHTATWEGSWRTAANELILWSNNAEAQAASTHKIDLWNFDVQVSFNLSQVANDEFAGFLFRALDHKNEWRCYYDQATDKIKVDHRVDDTDTNVAISSSTLGWSAAPETTRHLRLRAYYGLVWVYISTDGITWGSPHLTVTFPGQPALPPTSAGPFPTYTQQAGYVGLIGRGYNPTETWDYDFTFQLVTQIIWLWEDSLMIIVDEDPGGEDPGGGEDPCAFDEESEYDWVYDVDFREEQGVYVLSGSDVIRDGVLGVWSPGFNPYLIQWFPPGSFSPNAQPRLIEVCWRQIGTDGGGHPIMNCQVNGPAFVFQSWDAKNTTGNYVQRIEGITGVGVSSITFVGNIGGSSNPTSIKRIRISGVGENPFI